MAGRAIRAFLGEQPVKLICSGVGMFNGQVLFARIRTEPHDVLQAIHDALAQAFMSHGFPVLDESAKSWLEEGEEPHAFKAHASFIKVSKGLAHATEEQKRGLRSLRVTVDDIDAWKNVFFGTQLCHEFELLDMIGSTRDGYYPNIQLERFHDPPGGLSNPMVSLAAGPLRSGRLRVECGESGAGMEVSQCPAGYLVEELSEWPGQPDISQGDVIVAIGDSLLLGLKEADLEQRFGTAFEDGVVIIFGSWVTIKRTPQDVLLRAAQRLLKPWQEAMREAEEAETVSLYTEGGSKLTGLRYQLRTAAPSFEPDPLNLPGGDPWEKVTKPGFAFPAPTGWGTEFKTRVTKFDSSRFMVKARTGPCLDKEGAGKADVTPRTHQELREELRGARSLEASLEIATKNRALLSISNRTFALARMGNLGWLSEGLHRDQRLLDILSDLQDDLDAVEESAGSLSSALLSSLALSLARLKLRRPELFRAIAEMVRRVGIWRFADDEISSLLEGFSRARLCDEIVFQDAARLLMGRMKRLAPRVLVTMLTAFASSNIATEHLFFAAGDVIVASRKNFSLSHLAELANAFSRVRARHPLLLDTVPEVFRPLECSVEALVKVFSAYADTRQELGPEGYREIVASAIWTRRLELTSRTARQVLQAAGRARWPNVQLLEAAAQAAARDPSSWELEAMRECYYQLRVLPPACFPSRPQRNPEVADAHASLASGASATLNLRHGTLRVQAGIGAGVELCVCEAGYLVESVSDIPGQPNLSVGDVIIAIEGRLLFGMEEHEVELRFGEVFADGASVILGIFDEMKQMPLECVRSSAELFARGSRCRESSCHADVETADWGPAGNSVCPPPETGVREATELATVRTELGKAHADTSFKGSRSAGSRRGPRVWRPKTQ